MPLYSWKNEKTGTEVTVIRTVQDIEVPPTEEECPEEDPIWKRLMCASAKFLRGPNWSGKKGEW